MMRWARPGSRISNGRCLRAVAVYVVALLQALKLAPVNVQELGRFADVASGLGQRLHDFLPLQRAPAADRLGSVGSRSSRS